MISAHTLSVDVVQIEQYSIVTLDCLPPINNNDTPTVTPAGSRTKSITEYSTSTRS